MVVMLVNDGPCVIFSAGLSFFATQQKKIHHLLLIVPRQRRHSIPCTPYPILQHSLRAEEGPCEGCSIFETAERSHALKDIRVNVATATQRHSLDGFTHWSNWPQLCLVM